MSLLLYAVAERTSPETEGAGVDGGPLRRIEGASLVAVVGDSSGELSSPDPEALWRYEQAMEQLAGCHPVLPFRFGTTLADENEVETLLCGREQELRSVLERVRDAVELSVRVVWREGSPPHGAFAALDSSGTAYMQAQLELRRRAAQLARRLDPLTGLARRGHRRILPRPEVPVSGSYLVEREHVDDFVSPVARLDEHMYDADFVVTGPWPPYSFTKEEEDR